MKEIRELIAIKDGKEDTHYTLVRTANGEIRVETYFSPNKPFVRGRLGPTILPYDFDEHIIDGKPLRNYVNETLKKIDYST